MRVELREARKKLKKTQQQIADLSNMDRTKYNKIERGRMDPDVDEALSIARALRTKVEKIFLSNNVHQKHKKTG